MASPFAVSAIAARAVIADGLGGLCSFREHQSTSAQDSSDHLSLNVGLTVGNPCVSVGADVDYDRTVMQNENVGCLAFADSARRNGANPERQGMNCSRNSSSLVGRIILDQPPNFSPLALDLLRSENGRERFHAVYGDYYVSGFELGAHAAACLSVTTKTDSSAERTAIAVRAKVLFFEAKATVATTVTETADFSARVTFVSYNTLDSALNQNLTTVTSKFSDVGHIKGTVDRVLDGVSSLDATLRTHMDQLGIQDAQAITPAACQAIFDRGLVVGLFMAPFSRMEAYVQQQCRSKGV
jgi:hypothetical protein